MGFDDGNIGDCFANRTSLVVGKELDMLTMRWQAKRRDRSEAILVQFLGIVANF